MFLSIIGATLFTISTDLCFLYMLCFQCANSFHSSTIRFLLLLLLSLCQAAQERKLASLARSALEELGAQVAMGRERGKERGRERGKERGKERGRGRGNGNGIGDSEDEDREGQGEGEVEGESDGDGCSDDEPDFLDFLLDNDAATLTAGGGGSVGGDNSGSGSNGGGNGGGGSNPAADILWQMRQRMDAMADEELRVEVRECVSK